MRRLEEKKELNGVPDGNGHIFFAAHEVIALAIKRGVKVSASNAQLQTIVYEMLLKNEPPLAIMKATGLTIEQIRELHALLFTPLGEPVPVVVPMQGSPREGDAEHERRIREWDEELSLKRLAPFEEEPSSVRRHPELRKVGPLGRALANRLEPEARSSPSTALAGRKGRLR